MKAQDINVVVPVHPPRFHSTLDRALHSVWEQTRPPEALAVAVDYDHEGSAVTRNRALDMVRTPWVAFLDSDDQLCPDHLERLMDHAVRTGADLVYPWFTVPTGWDPMPEYEGQPFNEKALREIQNYIPTTVLVRTGLVKKVGGFENRNTSTEPGASPCDEWGLWLKLLDAGAEFSHLNRRTWRYWWGDNTSGRGDRW